MASLRSTAVRTAAAVTTALALAGCSTQEAPGARAATSSGNASACPGDVLDVVVSVSQWSDIVRELAGDCATVTTVVASAAVDPHDFEPGTSDLAAFTDAELVVVNGADYDSWADDAVAALDASPAVVSAAEVAGTEHGGSADVDPHLWYDPEVVERTATAVTEELTGLSPGAAAYFAERATAWTGELQSYLDVIADLRGSSAGRSYAATETVFDRMAAAIDLTDATPEGYRRASSNDSEPAPGDLADFEAALSGGRVDVLIYNTQTSGSVPEQLRDAAEEAGVPVVEVTESPADADGSFLAWQQAQLSELSDALGTDR